MLTKGDKVRKNGKYYVPERDKEKIFVVASDPWDVCGSPVVKLEGISGSYAADGLDVVPAPAEPERMTDADAEQIVARVKRLRVATMFAPHQCGPGDYTGDPDDYPSIDLPEGY